MTTYESIKRCDEYETDIGLQKKRLRLIVLEAHRCMPARGTPEAADEAESINMLHPMATQLGIDYLFVTPQPPPETDMVRFRSCVQKVLCRAITMMKFDSKFWSEP